MKVVLVRFKDGKRREFELKSETTIIGRRQDSTLCIASSDVSRQHCQVAVKGDAAVVKDLGSSNGTFVNGKRVAETKLAPGDRLSVGPVVFVVQINGKPAQIKPSDAKVATPAGAPKADEEEEVFDLSEEDFDIEDAIADLDKLDEDKDMP